MVVSNIFLDSFELTQKISLRLLMCILKTLGCFAFPLSGLILLLILLAKWGHLSLSFLIFKHGSQFFSWK